MNKFYINVIMVAVGLYLLMAPIALSLSPVWSDGFESGLGAWDSTYYNNANTIAVSGEQKTEGSSSCKIVMPELNGGVAYVHENLDTTYYNLVLESSLFLSQASLGATRRYSFMWIKGTTDPTYYFSTYASLRVDSNNHNLVLYYRDSAGYQTKASSTIVTMNTWNKFKLVVSGAESSDGQIKVYVNDVEVTGLATSYNATNGWGGIKSVRVGGELNSAEAGITVTSYIDNVKVSYETVDPTGNLEVHAFYDGTEVDAQFTVDGSTYQTTSTGYTVSLTPNSYVVNCLYSGETLTYTATITASQTTTLNFYFTSDSASSSDTSTSDTTSEESTVTETEEIPEEEQTTTPTETTPQFSLWQGIGLVLFGFGTVRILNSKKKTSGG